MPKLPPVITKMLVKPQVPVTPSPIETQPPPVSTPEAAQPVTPIMDKAVIETQTYIQNIAEPLIEKVVHDQHEQLPQPVTEARQGLEGIKKGIPLRKSSEILINEKRKLNEPGHAQKVMNEVAPHNIAATHTIAHPDNVSTDQEPDEVIQQANAVDEITSQPAQPLPETPQPQIITSSEPASPPASERPEPSLSPQTSATETTDIPNVRDEWQDPLNPEQQNDLVLNLQEAAEAAFNKNDLQAVGEIILALTARGENGAIMRLGALQDLQSRGFLSTKPALTEVITTLSQDLNDRNGAKPLVDIAVRQGVISQTDADGLTPQTGEKYNYENVVNKILSADGRKIDSETVKNLAGKLSGQREFLTPENIVRAGLAQSTTEAQKIITNMTVQEKELTEKLAKKNLSIILNILLLAICIVPSLTSSTSDTSH